MNTRSLSARERLQGILQSKGIEIVDYRPGHAGSGATVAMRCLTCGAPDTLRASTISAEWLGCRQCRRDQGLTRGPHRCYTTAAVAEHIVQRGGQYMGGEVTAHDSVVTYRCRHCGDVRKKSAKHMYRHGPSGRCCAGLRGSVSSAISGNWLDQAHCAARERGGRCLARRPITTRERIWWQCSRGHTWPQSYEVVVNRGNWCKRCSGSIAERYVISLLEAAFGAKFPSVRPEWLGGMELDGYCAELGLAVEVHGIQHYQRSQYYHESDEDLAAQQRRDELKQRLCDQRSLALLVVPYWVLDEGIAGIKNLITSRLDSMGFQPENPVEGVTVPAREIYDPSDAKHRQFSACVKSQGGRFLARDYMGLSSKLPVTCAKGHLFTPYPGNVIYHGTWCKKCTGTAQLSTEEVKQLLAELRWSLDEGEEYVSAQSVLRLRCPNGHLLQKTWNSWQQSKAKRSYVRCKQCDVDSKISTFACLMGSRGLTLTDGLEQYTHEHAVSAECGHCGAIRTRQIRAWNKATRTPCCGYQFVDTG